MPARKRRASTSTVESTDESQIRWKQECNVVRTVDKGTHSDDWPVFELCDAIVLDKTGQTLQNALEVTVKGPFIVRGTLIIDDPMQRSCLVTRVKTSTPLEIRHNEMFSIGESADCIPTVWLSGRGGWYEFRPAPAYRPIYRKMCEAVHMYYRFVDIYKSLPPPPPPKRSKSAKRADVVDDGDLDPIFKQYAALAGDGCTRDEVVERCHQHAGFFISQFAREEEPVDLQATPFYRWLTTKHADLFRRIDEVIKNPKKPALMQLAENTSVEKRGPKHPTRTTAAATNSSSSSSSSPSTDVIAGRRRGEGRHHTLKPPIKAPPRHSSSAIPPHPSKSSPDSPSPPGPFKRQRKNASIASRNPATRTSPKPPAKASAIGLPAAANTMSQPNSSSSSSSSSSKPPAVPLFDLRSLTIDQSSSTTAADSAWESILEAFDFLYDACNGSQKGIGKNPFISKFYFAYYFPCYRNGTSGCHKIPTEEVLHYYSAALVDSLNPSKWAKHEIFSYLKDQSARKLHPVAYKPGEFPIIMRHRKSIQRKPQNNDQPASAATPADVHADSSRKPHGKSLTRLGRKAGVKSTLRPASSSKKRPRSDLEGESESETSEVRNSHYFNDGDEVMEDAPDATDASDTAAAMVGVVADSDPPADPHGGGGGGGDDEPIRLVIRAERMPSMVPRGPAGTWTCEEDGCDYFVRGSDLEDYQTRIRAHFSDHEQQLERVSLAVTESRGHLPIKYAYFPPFLILVELLPSTSPSPPPAATTEAFGAVVSLPPPAASRPAMAAATAPKRRSNDAARPDPSGSAKAAFRNIVTGYRWAGQLPPPRKMRNLTVWQSPTREDQAHGREGAEQAAGLGRRLDARAADQAETDSVTVMGD